MFKNYFKIAWRNLWKSKGHSAINILGLAVGLASFLIILLYLNHELSYDKWHDDLKRVFKVSAQSDQDILERTPAPLAAFLKENVSLIEQATRISPAGSFELLIGTNDKKIYQTGSIEADSLFFKVFPFKITQGDAASPLDKPNAIVLSESVAQKLFGQDNPIGKTIKVYNSFDCEVTAVMQAPNKPSNLIAELVYRAPYEKSNTFWTNYSYQTYVKTKQNLTPAVLEHAVDKSYYDLRVKKDETSLQQFRKAGHQAGLFVDALEDLHNFPKHGHSNFATVSMLLILAVLLLLAGAINFSNLSIAGSIRRAKEIGIRKVMGSSNRQLSRQFLGEIGLQCLLALLIALLLVQIMLPYFNREFQVSLGFIKSGKTLSLFFQIMLCLLLVILLSGLYPAVFLSRYNTSKVLKGDYSRGARGATFRNTLIVIQFVVSAFFVIGTGAIGRQMHYMQTKDKGFSGEQVMRIQATQQARDTDFETTQHRLLDIPGVQYVSKTTTVPGDPIPDTSTKPFNYAGNSYRMGSVKVSADYFSTLNVSLLEGRSFTNSYADQHTQNAIINASAAKKMNLTSPLGATITFPGCDSIPIQIVGVVNDFNVSGFESSVLPIVYTIGNDACMFQSGGAILVKLNTRDIRKSVAAIEQVWKDIEPDFPIRYSFLDDNFQQLFASYIRLQRVITFFCITAISIALIGLFALTAFLVNQRTKEIGIRKVMGAELSDLGILLSKDFVKLVCIAVIIAIPLGWWAVDKWLQDFAYHIALDGWLFVGAALAVIAVAVITISFQVMRAATANPVDSLRNE